MVLDGPILALSDIMHGMASSPTTSAPQEDDTAIAESATPEPLDYAQIEVMRKRVLELIVSGASKMSTSSREKELIEMVIRLTSTHTPDVAQLYTQAKTIQELCRQRDFIIEEVSEERARRSHGGDSTYREEELERQVAILGADNKALRQKLSEYQVKVQSVEAELAQLRPVLLMQPYALTHSFSPSHDHYLHSSTPKVDVTRRVKRRKQDDQDQEATEEEPDTSILNSSTPRTKPRGDYYRRRDTDQFGDNPRHRKRTQKKGGASLADARAEHVLLAARRVGRERASILAAGSPRSHDKESPKKDNGHTDPTPKTPRKHQTTEVGNGSSTCPIPATADTASAEHRGHLLPSRKSLRNNVTQERVTRNNPLTSLDSLLTAATSTKASTRRSPAVAPASPVPTKRRRLASSRLTRSLPSVTASSDKGPSGVAGRTRSALDVLADQAAVFSSQEHDSASSKGGGRGMAKESHSTGDSGRQTSRSRAPQPKNPSSSRLLSASTPSSSAQPATETTLDHGPPPLPVSETQPPSSPPKQVPPRPPSTEPPQGTATTMPKDTSPTDSTRTSSAVKSAP
ncbi:hypothetical protein EDB83DRAFT_2347768 [Lactarius deliciosus]|nr:hypothetical protein EDB83DRAFT_2347768 [Lactarius deliciosus]